MTAAWSAVAGCWFVKREDGKVLADVNAVIANFTVYATLPNDAATPVVSAL